MSLTYPNDKTIHRSPGYPVVSLEEALEKARFLWEKNGQSLVRPEVAAEQLGYAHYRGSGARNIAALKQYGLAHSEEGYLKLTAEAIDLLVYTAQDDNYFNILQKCALYPKLFHELFNYYNGSLPSDNVLKAQLIKEYKFNPKKVDKFLSNFRDTLRFADLIGQRNKIIDNTQQNKTRVATVRPKTDDMIEKAPSSRRTNENNSDTNDIYGDTIQQTITYPRLDQASSSVRHSYPILLSDQTRATVSFEKLPIKRKDFERIKKWLDLQEDVLVEPSDS
jgi:hypothetical protein